VHNSGSAYAGAMATVHIPGTTLHVSDIVFGTNIFGWSIHDQSEANRILDAVVDAGINFLDSADMYVQWHPGGVGGESERMIGSWLATSGKRDQVVIATKVGKMTARPGLRRDNIIAAVDDSLRRLGTDHIDLYYAHFDDRETPLEETLETFHELAVAGKVLALGASNYSAQRLHEAHTIATTHSLTPYVAVQNEYNLVTRDHYESDTAPAATELGLVGFPFFGLASGFLTGKYRPGVAHDSVRSERVAKDYLTDGNLKTLDRLITVAKKHGAEPATVAIEWLRRQPGVHAPIASARNTDQLAALLARVDLTDEDVVFLSGETT
jgi:aryl-alcohol dehydrogenase-like predicted oxidoreductase